MVKDKGNSGYKYGSVDNDEEPGAKGVDKNYDESNLYYMKEDNVTKEDKAFKAMKLAVPIIIAAMFIGGLAFMLFHNFAYFYPGRDGHTKTSGSTNPTTTTEHTYYDDDALNTQFPASATFGFNDNDSPGVSIPTSLNCKAYPKCVSLGLTGACCPTGEGIELECCG